ncbi:MAG: ubiquinone anaerobic biosynthesis accessory factor UbiT [Cognatishimia sp.]
MIPLAPLSFTLTAYSRAIARQHPGLFRRLGDHVEKNYVLDPTDLPIVIYLRPNGGTPRVQIIRGSIQADARISGRLAALLGLVHGAFDGDALFFSRDLVVEGDTAAALALRNAVDDAELDLAAEMTRFSGPLAGLVKRLIDQIEHQTGMILTRPEEALEW